LNLFMLPFAWMERKSERNAMHNLEWGFPRRNNEAKRLEMFMYVGRQW
jgi:hypothetical protein